MKSVPSTFMLGSRTWTVHWKKSKKYFGVMDISKCQIIMSSTLCVSDEIIMHTFFHELMHAIAATLGWEDLNNNEEKIDAIANLLAQVEQSAVWGGL